jgi:3-oxoacyl-ACP reductase-like protein
VSRSPRTWSAKLNHRWTCGTGLMNQSNMIAQEIETHGVRTFSAKEMAFNVLGLMHPVLLKSNRSGVT